MLKVWRGKGRMFAECKTCGSYGSTHIEVETRMTPEIAAALEKHTAHMLSLRAHFTKAATAVADKVRTKELTSEEAQTKIRDMWNNHVATIQTAQMLLPNPDGKVTHHVVACPWCKAPSDVQIEELPDDVAEPAFELGRVVSEHLAKSAAADAAKQKKEG